MQFFGSFGRTAGVLLGLYVSVKIVIEIESHLRGKRAGAAAQTRPAPRQEAVVS
ncbi:hypothetical protein [Paraburkholderia adhaesiva]|uniref:hypothetical protein n=1 Tax=Paraburkholderia adhaesiva TaxID=2883244 RepID=UPI001F3366A2|nr:hypothetical protein [Paraburkholderia adhaesiva]